MAWKHIQAAFEFEGPCSADALSVLRVIAYNIRENGFAYCGSSYIMRKIGRRSRKTAQTAINELVALGYLVRVSGRPTGHRNHYFLNIPGAPYTGGEARFVPPVKRASPVDKPRFQPVNKSPVYTPEEGEVCKPRPQEMGNPRPDMGKAPSVGCVEDAHGNRDIKQSREPEGQNQVEGAVYTPEPQSAIQRTAPIDSPEFRQQAIRICNDAGASLAEAVKFYEHHQAEDWAVLEHMPLEIAARQYVAAWKERDMKAWSTEQLTRFRREHNL